MLENGGLEIVAGYRFPGERIAGWPVYIHLSKDFQGMSVGPSCFHVHMTDLRLDMRPCESLRWFITPFIYL